MSEPITVTIPQNYRLAFPLVAAPDAFYSGIYTVEIRDAAGWYLGYVCGQKQSLAKANASAFVARCNCAKRLLAGADFVNQSAYLRR